MKNGLEVAGLGVHTLKDVDMTLAPGQCAGLSGPSGAGKTLFLRAVADMDPHRGTVRLAGAAAGDVPPPQWRRRVALLPAETAWWHDTVGPHFDVVDHHGLASLGFEPAVFDWRISRLSSGERQRLGVLRMLQHLPRVLLLDEPTANLDADNTRQVEDLLAQYRRKHRAMAIWVSHDMHQLRRNCHCIYAIKGHVLVLQPPAAAGAGAP